MASNESHRPGDGAAMGAPAFVTTHWSVVLTATGADTTKARAALEHLWWQIWINSDRKHLCPPRNLNTRRRTCKWSGNGRVGGIMGHRETANSQAPGPRVGAAFHWSLKEGTNLLESPVIPGSLICANPRSDERVLIDPAMEHHRMLQGPEDFLALCGNYSHMDSRHFGIRLVLFSLHAKS